MARRLPALSGIKPLTIDQVAITDPEPDSLNAALVQRVWATNLTGSPALILRNKESAKPFVLGSYAGDTDLQVVHVPTRYVDRRPDWLSMNGHRHPQPIPGDLLPLAKDHLVADPEQVEREQGLSPRRTGRHLVQAFTENETDSPVAVDQVGVDAMQPRPSSCFPRANTVT